MHGIGHVWPFTAIHGHSWSSWSLMVILHLGILGHANLGDRSQTNVAGFGRLIDCFESF